LQRRAHADLTNSYVHRPRFTTVVTTYEQRYRPSRPNPLQQIELLTFALLILFSTSRRPPHCGPSPGRTCFRRRVSVLVAIGLASSWATTGCHHRVSILTGVRVFSHLAVCGTLTLEGGRSSGSRRIAAYHIRPGARSAYPRVNGFGAPWLGLCSVRRTTRHSADVEVRARPGERPFLHRADHLSRGAADGAWASALLSIFGWVLVTCRSSALVLGLHSTWLVN